MQSRPTGAAGSELDESEALEQDLRTWRNLRMPRFLPTALVADRPSPPIQPIAPDETNGSSREIPSSCNAPQLTLYCRDGVRGAGSCA